MFVWTKLHFFKNFFASYIYTKKIFFHYQQPLLYIPGQNYVIVAYFLKHGTEDAETRNKKTSTDNSFGPGLTVIFY